MQYSYKFLQQITAKFLIEQKRATSLLMGNETSNFDAEISDVNMTCMYQLSCRMYAIYGHDIWSDFNLFQLSQIPSVGRAE